jgi:hypothetical protein
VAVVLVGGAGDYPVCLDTFWEVISSQVVLPRCPLRRCRCYRRQDGLVPATVRMRVRVTGLSILTGAGRVEGTWRNSGVDVEAGALCRTQLWRVRMVSLWCLFPHLHRRPPPRPPLLCQGRLQRSAPALRLENETKMAVSEVTTSGSSPSLHQTGPPLWSSGQSSWLQIRRPGFDSRHYQKKK